jgi:hypothetical protein
MSECMVFSVTKSRPSQIIEFLKKPELFLKVSFLVAVSLSWSKGMFASLVRQLTLN